jgi:hypothetical protein
MRIRPLPDPVISVLVVVSMFGLFCSGAPAGAVIGWRLAKARGSISGFLVGSLYGIASFVFPFLVGLVLFGKDARLNERWTGRPIPLLWLGFSACCMAIVGACLVGLAVATRFMGRWRRTWPRRQRPLLLRAALGAALGAIVGGSVGIVAEILGSHTSFHEYGGLLFLPVLQLSTIGAVGGFLDGKKQVRARSGG